MPRTRTTSLAGRLAGRIVKAFGQFGLIQVSDYQSGWVNLVGGEALAGDWQRNIRLGQSHDSLLRFGAVYACISLISGDISKLEICLRRWNTTAQIWDEILPQEVHRNDAAAPVLDLLDKPNDYQTRIQFISSWIISKLLWGNTFVLKERKTIGGAVVAEHILDPWLVTPLVAPDGDVYYALKRDYLAKIDNLNVVVPASEVIHDRMNCFWHPLIGVPPLFAAALSGMQGLAIQGNARKFFENQSRPSGLLLAPGQINRDKAQEIKERWEAGFSGENIGKTAVLGDGMTYEPMAIAAEQAQLAEQWGLTSVDVARAFLVPPFKIGVESSASGANLSQLDQDYYSQCLQPYMEAIESCQDTGLDLPSDIETEFDLDGLFRMDPLGRAETNLKRVQAGELAPDEARAASNLPPVPGGKYPYLQQQNFSLEALAKRDQSADPFAHTTVRVPTPVEPQPPPLESSAEAAAADANAQANQPPPAPPPSAKEIAREVLAAMPAELTAAEVAAQIVLSLPKPEEKAVDTAADLAQALILQFPRAA